MRKPTNVHHCLVPVPTVKYPFYFVVHISLFAVPIFCKKFNWFSVSQKTSNTNLEIVTVDACFKTTSAGSSTRCCNINLKGHEITEYNLWVSFDQPIKVITKMAFSHLGRIWYFLSLVSCLLLITLYLLPLCFRRLFSVSCRYRSKETGLLVDVKSCNVLLKKVCRPSKHKNVCGQQHVCYHKEIAHV